MRLCADLRIAGGKMDYPAGMRAPLYRLDFHVAYSHTMADKEIEEHSTMIP